MSLKASVFRKLGQIAGIQNCSRKPEDLMCYAYDATAETAIPDAVIFPRHTEDVSDILKLAYDEHIFVIPRGAGSGLTGGSVPVRRGIVLVMNRMNRILEIDTDNLIAHVQPGVITGDFHKAVEQQGLFYPPDPASSEFSTLGGNLAECAGGPRAVKYGVTRDYVLGLEAVIGTGEIIHTGVRTAKGVAGYDLTRLIVGSEGTLAVITKMILRLLPLPESIGTLTAVFDDMENAAQSVSDIIRQGIIPRTIEFMDNAAICCVEEYLKIGLPTDADAMLLIEADGKASEIEPAMNDLERICKSHNATVNLARSASERAKLWQARKAVSPALFRYGPHKINEDIVVPRSRIPLMVRKIRELKEKSGLMIAAFGHAGDGNIHFNIMLDKRNIAQLKTANDVVDKLFDYTLELGGTISGEHGIGITKAPYLSKEIGKTEIALMKQIKAVFDPKGILNPGKIFNG